MPPSSHSTSLHIPQQDPASSSSSRHHQSPSAPSSAGRPVSATVQQPAPPSTSAPARRQQRGVSHQVVSPSHNINPDQQPNEESIPNHVSSAAPYPDVYNHPAALQYIESHPRRTIPKFGPYLLLQTLGEGEFGKVKLGLHSQWGEEVAVKLIRRGNVDNSTRMSKVEREIEVLKSLKHPNIVRLYDVIETDKYIGIILEYASGGELFDHILAHRYLRERDAQKLFHQLISGVWYIHQKKIVHRDLKLENLLLDRNRNVLITDFGFANRFEHRADDLMQTSCGSPCYAAPELVISEGLYVGSAVDIWSCGVILYAMLAGYLPFDDDPANPDGDNINLLYRYIVNTPLTFPDYITPGARDLLSIMLVPDPTRRASLDIVMRHSWLSEFMHPRKDGKPNAFGKTVEDLEKSAMDLHHQKRIAYQKQLKKEAQLAREAQAAQQQRSQSNRVEARATTTVLPSAGRSTSVQPELYYESNAADQSLLSSPTPTGSTTPQQQQKKQYGSPAALGLSEDDPFAAPGSAVSNVVVTTTTTTTTSKGRSSEERNGLSPLQAQPQSPPKQGHKSGGSGGGGFRHTIQVEYDAPANSGSRKSRDRSGSHGQQQQQPSQDQPPAQPLQQPQPSPPREQRKQANGVQSNGVASPTQSVSPAVQPVQERRPSQSNGPIKPLPPHPNVSSTPSSYKPPVSAGAAPASAAPTTPKVTPPTPKQSPRGAPDISVSSPPLDERETASQSSGSGGKRSHQRARSSVDKFTLGKIFGTTNSSSAPSPVSPSVSQAQDGSSVNGSVSMNGRNDSASVLLSPVSADKESSKSGGKEKEGRKSRRNTLTVMVEPFRNTIKGRSAKSKTATTPVTTGPQKSAASMLPPPPSAFPPSSQGSASASPSFVNTMLDAPPTSSLPASTPKAKNVMGWFRSRSKGHNPVAEMVDEKSMVDQNDGYKRGWSASNTAVNQHPPTSAQEPAPVTSPRSGQSTKPPSTPHRTASDAPSTPSTTTPSIMNRIFRNSVTVGGIRHENRQQPQQPRSTHEKLRVHHGPVDQMLVTTKPPQEVMRIAREVLEGMGIEIQVEGEFKYRCIRAKRKRTTTGTSSAPGAGSVSPGGLAAVAMVGTAASNGVDKRGLPLPSPSTFSSTGGMLRGLLMRRQSSQPPSNTSQPSLAFDDETSVIVGEPQVLTGPTTYGDDDAGDEVRFYVELTRIAGLNDTYHLDPRRLKGSLKSYKFLYDTLRQRSNLAG